VALPASWRRARQFLRHFRIDAPRMAVRSRLPWPWRAVAGVVLLAIVGGMWWWGFDFGQIFGGFNRKEVEARLVSLENENSRLTSEATQLRTRNSRLESELAMTAGTQATLQKQSLELMAENTQLKEELSFLQKLVSDSSKQVGVSIARLSVDREGEDAWRYHVLIVRGGSPRDEFEGALTLQASLQPPAGEGQGRPSTLTLPDDDPDTAAALALKFKYYPPGFLVRSVTVRAFENGQTNARATRTLAVS
jgi:hypothetical protein